MITADAAGWLSSPAGRAVVADISADPAAELAEVARLRSAGYALEQVSAAVECAQARDRVRERLGASDWLLSRVGVEQATRPEVARLRATRFVDQRLVVDLTCGLGFDLAALTAVSAAVGVDQDPATAILAGANVPEALVACCDARSVRIPARAAVFVDPMRRDASGRRLSPEHSSPPLSWVLTLPVATLGVKVAPGLDRSLVPDDHEFEVVSADGDVVEAGIYRGAARRGSVRRRATLLRREVRTDPASAVASYELTDQDLPSCVPVASTVDGFEEYLYEPDGAVIRAGLVAAVCQPVSGALIDPQVALITSAQRHLTPFAATFQLLDAMPFSLKTLRQRVREYAPGSVVVKTRATALSAEGVRRALPTTAGGRELVVMLTRVGTAPWALLMRRVTAQPTGSQLSTNGTPSM